ncbi:hypothetical protein EVAR_63829_1 [Eumeta japonica]|uniref:Uncharacterized protein n=1 Tax=Eumeta variegata TaxID=151549 RepID=A0A4C2AEF1_EUMVA|nr:hypothetical protein EVAR_63829_1 [Eumeta japonica]
MQLRLYTIFCTIRIRPSKSDQSKEDDRRRRRGSSIPCYGCRCGCEPMARTPASSQEGHYPLGSFFTVTRQPSSVRQLTPSPLWAIWIPGLVGAGILSYKLALVRRSRRVDRQGSWGFLTPILVAI